MSYPARRLASLALAAALSAGTLLAVAGCTDPAPTASASASGSTSATATASGSAEENVAWAQAVCTSLDTTRTDIKSIGSGLTVDLSAGSGAVDQLKAEVSANVQTAQSSLDDLRSAIAAAPANDGAQALRSTLETAASDLDSATQGVADAASGVANANGITEVVAAAGQTGAAVAKPVVSAGTFATTMTTAASNASGEVKAAFAEAPACQALSS